jgi:hypothetical protein
VPSMSRTIGPCLAGIPAVIFRQHPLIANIAVRDVFLFERRMTSSRARAKVFPYRTTMECRDVCLGAYPTPQAERYSSSQDILLARMCLTAFGAVRSFDSAVRCSYRSAI